MSRRRSQRGHGAEEHVNEERWLLTYADMITLLLALFILLFAISTINQKKFLALELGLKEQFSPNSGVLSGGDGVLDQPDVVQKIGKITAISTSSTTTATEGQDTSAAITSQNLSQLQQKIQAALDAKHLQADASLVLQERGLVVQILADNVFFATGSANISNVGNEVIDTVSKVISPYEYDVDVEGFTDDRPVIGGQYGSNEVLSSVRADNVVLRMEDIDKIDPNRLSATGYGDTHPVKPNTTPANMAQNRRIDIVILSSSQGQP